MLPVTPYSYVPFPAHRDCNSQQHSPDSECIHCSNFWPRKQNGAGLTQSVRVQSMSDGPSKLYDDDPGNRTFTETVQVVSVGDGFRMLRSRDSVTSHQRQMARRIDHGVYGPSSTLAAQAVHAESHFSHNITSKNMRQRMNNRLSAVRLWQDMTQSLDIRHANMSSLTAASHNCVTNYGTTSQLGNAAVTSGSPDDQRKTLHQSLMHSPQQKKEEEFQCSCLLYHSHTFKGRPVNKEVMQESHKFIDMLTASMNAADQREENHEDLRNIFWTPSLSFHSYQHGDKLVEFSDLWPGMLELHNHFQNSGIQRTVLRDYAVLDLCKLAITCGPVRLLRCLIELELVRVDQLVENETGMLHVAVLAHNTEAIQYLTSHKISPRLRDRAGYTSDQVCYSSALRRHLPPKYLLHKEARQLGDNRMVLKPSLQDKDTIFKLATNPKYFDEIQKKLQTLDFNVNTECDASGDFLLHIVCKKGLSQLPLIMALVKIQGADVELCNAKGLTPLMLAAAAGNCVLCDVLMCLFGADPNKPNPNTGHCALHYAVEGNHRKTVECLLRRGADVNVEDHQGRRSDDVPLCLGTNDDCHEVIQFNRTRRMEALCERIRKGELEKHHLLKSDLCVVDSDGYTLIMTAAIHNRADVLETLLQINKSTIDAQHVKTGVTALAIAAQMGNVDAVEMLLSHGAKPTIGDMQDYLPLHHAVLNNQEKVVDIMLEYFPDCYWGLYTATRLCKRTSIYVKLKSAFTRRQEELVTPELLACAMNDSADKLYQLLEEGDNINVKSGTGNWPLYLAVENGHLDVVKLLFERGGDIRKRHSTTGETVMHLAAKMGHFDIIQYLLNFCHQAHIRSSRRPSRKLLDINTTDSNNCTPLQVAAEKGYSRIVEMLLKHGATTALLDGEGQLITCPHYEGVRMQIEAHRQQHMRDVVTCITDRSRKAFEQLQKIWLPRFDHNLRTKQGDTPLMVTCAAGKLQVLKFLLESAVYPKTRQEEDSDDDSDADSGVLDPTGGSFQKHRVKSSDGEELQTSGAFNQSMEGLPGQLGSSGEHRDLAAHIPEDVESKREADPGLPSATPRGAHRSLEALLHDINRPKGLYIFHDGLISHVCAVNLDDSSTALHRAIEYGDNYQMVKALLTADLACINIQNNAGLSPLHLACKLGRKKVIEQLMLVEGIDLNVRTLDSLLPEEMTTNKSIIRIVQKARLQQTGQAKPPPKPNDPDINDGSLNTPSQAGSSVNFDQLHSRYEALRKETQHTV